MSHVTAHGVNTTGSLGGDRRYSQSVDSDAMDQDDKTYVAAGGSQDGASPASLEGQARKRRRSRKGLDKRFDCSEAGCGKSYSRAEHLYRHQLNHNSNKTFYCDYPGCSRTFVRGDLLKRHLDRHTAKGSQLSRRDSMMSQNSQPAVPGSASPEVSRASQPPGNTRHLTTSYHGPEETAQGHYPPMSEAPPLSYMSENQVGINQNNFGGGEVNNGHTTPHRLRQKSPVLHQRSLMQSQAGTQGAPSSGYHQSQFSNQPSPRRQSANYVVQQNVMPLNLPPSQYANGQGSAHPAAGQHYETSPEDAEMNSASSGEMSMLAQMAMPGTVPVFGSDGVLSKSPYGGMPDDFLTYLFNSNSTPASPMQAQHPSYAGLQNAEYALPHVGHSSIGAGYFPASSQQVMAVNNLLDQNVPETTISDEKSQEIFEFIRDRFQETEHASAERSRDSIINGERTYDSHMLSKRMMQAYIGSYWYHFSDQLPILHKATFSPDNTPVLLILSMMTIGAACLDRTHGQKVTKAGAKLSNYLAWNLRWNIFMDASFRPPAKLWVFQTLILLELYEKMYSTRELHERAHIHHATTIQLMRRGRSLIGKSAMESPLNPAGSADGSRHSSTSAVTQTPEEWWQQWIINEATRRAAFAAFIVDSTHATMFGHSAVMVAHEMRLPLPCDETMWQASCSAEVGRIEANLLSRGIRPVSFLEGLKRTLMGHEVPTNTFGRTALMAGLLSVAWHMNQRDLQVSFLGQNVSQTLGGRDKWKATLNSAYDFWRMDYDKALQRSELDPYLFDAAKKNEHDMAAQSRTVYHHLAHMAMHADVVDCQMYARAKRLLGRAIGSAEFAGAQKRVTAWAHSARARDATFYALKFLCSVLGDRGQHRRDPYNARDDIILNRPWVLYFSMLIVWCYGQAIEGPTNFVRPNSPNEREHQMQEYLHRFISISNPDDLRSYTGINNNTALLVALKETFEHTRWELLHEGSNLLKNCITINTGGKVR